MNNSRTYDKTWTKKRLGIVIAVSIVYGIWFNLIDSVAFCQYSSKDSGGSCKSIGEIFGGQEFYQSWNIVGHFLPGLFMLLLFKQQKLELFLAAFLISTVVMDSPLWGVERRIAHGLSLWHGIPNANTTVCPVVHPRTFHINEWVMYYYNPIGFDLVWDCSWLFPNFPTAAAIFWSLVGRISAAILLIWYQERIEARGEYFSLKKLVIKK
jgi:hypothetical protein